MEASLEVLIRLQSKFKSRHGVSLVLGSKKTNLLPASFLSAPHYYTAIVESSSPLAITRAHGARGRGAASEVERLRREINAPSLDFDAYGYHVAVRERCPASSAYASATRTTSTDERALIADTNVYIDNEKHNIDTYVRAGGPAAILILRRGTRRPYVVAGETAMMLIQMSRIMNDEKTLFNGWCSLSLFCPLICFAGHLSEMYNSVHGTGSASLRASFYAISKAIEIDEDISQIVADAHKKFLLSQSGSAPIFEFFRNGVSTISSLILHRTVLLADKSDLRLVDRLLEFCMVDFLNGVLVSEGRLKSARSRIHEHYLLGPNPDLSRVATETYTPTPSWLSDIPYLDVEKVANIDKTSVPHPQPGLQESCLERDSEDLHCHGIRYEPMRDFKLRLITFLKNDIGDPHHPRNVRLSLTVEAGCLAPLIFPSCNNLEGFAFAGLIRNEDWFIKKFPKLRRILNDEMITLSDRELATYATLMQEALCQEACFYLEDWSDHSNVCPGVSCAEHGKHICAVYTSVVRLGDKERNPKVQFELLNAVLDLILPSLNAVLKRMSIGKAVGGKHEESIFKPLIGSDILAASLDAKGSTDYRSRDVIRQILSYGAIFEKQHFSSESQYLAVMMALNILNAPQATLTSRPAVVRFNLTGIPIRSFSNGLRIVHERETPIRSLKVLLPAVVSPIIVVKKPVLALEGMSENLRLLRENPGATELSKLYPALVQQLCSGGNFLHRSGTGQGKTLGIAAIGTQLDSGVTISFNRTDHRKDAQQEFQSVLSNLGLACQRDGHGPIFAQYGQGAPLDHRWTSPRVTYAMAFFIARLARNTKEPRVFCIEEISQDDPNLAINVHECLINPNITLILSGAGSSFEPHYKSLGLLDLPIAATERSDAEFKYLPLAESWSAVESNVRDQESEGCGTVLVYLPSTVMCDNHALRAKNAGIDYAILHGSAHPDMRKKAIGKADTARVTFISAAGIFGYNYDRCTRLVALPEAPKHAFCHHTGFAVSATVALSDEYTHQLLHRLSRRGQDSAPKITLLSRDSGSGLNVTNPDLCIDWRAPYLVIRSQRVKGYDFGPHKDSSDALYGPDRVLEIIARVSLVNPPVDVQVGAAYHYGASRRNRDPGVEYKMSATSLMNMQGVYYMRDMAEALGEEFLVNWFCAQGPVHGLNVTKNELYDELDTIEEDLRDSRNRIRQSPEDYWEDPAWWCDYMIAKLPRDDGKRLTVLQELSFFFLKVFNMPYAIFRKRFPKDPRPLRKFQTLARCNPLGVAKVCKEGFAQNLTYSSEFPVPREIPIGTVIYAPNVSVIRAGNRTRVNVGVIAVLESVVLPASRPIPHEDQTTIDDLILSSISRGRAEVSHTKPVCPGEDAYQFVVRYTDVTRQHLTVAAPNGSLYCAAIGIRPAVHQFNRNVSEFLLAFSHARLTRAAQNLGTVGNFANLITLTDAATQATSLRECVRLLDRVLDCPRLPSRLHREYQALGPGGKEILLRMARDCDVTAVVGNTFGDDLAALVGGNRPAVLLFLIRVHCFLIDQWEHPPSCPSADDLDPATKSQVSWVVRDGRPTGSLVAWCSRFLSVDVRDVDGKQQCRLVEKKLFRSGQGIYALGRKVGFLVGTASEHNWATSLGILKKHDDVIGGGQLCAELVRILSPEATNDLVIQNSLLPYTRNDDRFNQHRHMRELIEVKGGDIELVATESLSVRAPDDLRDVPFSQNDLVKRAEAIHGWAYGWTHSVEKTHPIFPRGHDAKSRALRVRRAVVVSDEDHLKDLIKNMTARINLS